MDRHKETEPGCGNGRADCAGFVSGTFLPARYCAATLGKRLQMISALIRLLCRAGWAPMAVLILHAIVAKTPLREPLDFAMHFSGGAAIAYFLFESQHYFQSLLGSPTPLGRYLFAFALACTVGVFWEFGELFSDTFLDTHIQKSIHETMSDLVADATGAITSLAVVCLTRYFLKSPNPQGEANGRQPVSSETNRT
jgi:hypothetical protein